MRHRLPPVPKFNRIPSEEERPRKNTWKPPPWDHSIRDMKGHDVHLVRTKILGQVIVYTVEEQRKACRRFVGEDVFPVGYIGDGGLAVHATKDWHESGFGTIIAYTGTYQFQPKNGETIPTKVEGKKSDPHAVPHIFFLCEEYDARKAAKKRATQRDAATAFVNPLSS